MAQDNTRQLVRLDSTAYQALEREVIPIHVGNDTTELQAGYQLGIQLVLKKLREGYVIGA